MEYCELGDLSFFIKKRDKLNTNPATVGMTRKYPNPPAGGLNEVVSRHFLQQLASALAFLRARNFIHRDVKPQNLLLNPSAKYLASAKDTPLIMSVTEDSMVPKAGIDSLPMLKLADFGFARSLPSTSLAETLCGSPLYMAPEILRYEKYDAKADLWSVGTVLYEMVTGKPPFRAANHVDLLRKIEQGDDVIKFSRDYEVSTAMKALIRGLLKRNPVERISFENFFDHEVVKNVIPGLVGDDISKPPAAQPRDIRQNDPRRIMSESQRPIEQANQSRRSASEQQSERPSTSHPATGSSPRISSRPRNPNNDPYTDAKSSSRPQLPPSSTAPNIYQDTAREKSGGEAMTRKPSQGTGSSGGTSHRGLVNAESNSTRKGDRSRRETEEHAAQEVMFERDYVVIEKRSVEVNAFADQLAADPLLTRSPQGQTTVSRSAPTRRFTTQGQPSSATGAVAAQPSRALQIAQGKSRPEHQRQNSYERRYGPSPGSTTSAISKAIAGASLRLFGIGYTPQLIGKGQSPPQLYNPFPAYPAAAGISGMIADGRAGPLDEDSKAVLAIEESATRSDVVYGFAEVKYKQLTPLPPSMDHGLGGHAMAGAGEDDDGGLTPDAVVTLSEEALVLYVKALGLLARSMDIAGTWWSRRNRGEVIGPGGSPRSSSATVIAAGNRINSAVQWVRSRFNEVLEKAEFVRLKLIEAQKQLPEDHPGHPNNHTSVSNIGTSSNADGVFLSSGVTAEKLMYDRALEMSRSAAINEIANTDLPGCEISYVTAIRMLEAVLEDDEPNKKTSGLTREDRSDDGSDNGINLDDREAVQKGM